MIISDGRGDWLRLMGVLALLPSLPLMKLAFERRNTFPLSDRMLAGVVANCLVMVPWVVLSIIVGWSHSLPSDNVEGGFRLLFVGIVSWTTTVRMAGCSERFTSRLHLEKRSLVHLNLRGSSSQSTPPVTAKKRVYLMRNWLKATLVYLVLIVALFWVGFFTDIHQNVLANGLVWLHFPFQVYLMLKFPSIPDRVGLKNELRIESLYLAVISLVSLGLHVVVADSSAAYDYFLFCSVYLVHMGTSLVWPIHMSSENTEAAVKRAHVTNSLMKIDLLNMREFLHTNQGFRLFYRFLAQEFCAELLLFWRECQQYRAMLRADKTKRYVHPHGLSAVQYAEEIAQQYLIKGAAHEVNVVWKIRKETLSRLGQLVAKVPDPGKPEIEEKDRVAWRRLFDESRFRVFNGLQNDPWLRFQCTSEYSQIQAHQFDKMSHASEIKTRRREKEYHDYDYTRPSMDPNRSLLSPEPVKTVATAGEATVLSLV